MKLPLTDRLVRAFYEARLYLQGFEPVSAADTAHAFKDYVRADDGLMATIVGAGACQTLSIVRYYQPGRP